jgi:hypothetical protein
MALRAARRLATSKLRPCAGSAGFSIIRFGVL